MDIMVEGEVASVIEVNLVESTAVVVVVGSVGEAYDSLFEQH